MSKKKKMEQTGQEESDAETTAAVELEQLQKELEEAKTQAAEYLDGWQRSQAEFANYRKRQEAERRQQVRLSNAALIAKLLPLLDDLERAVQTLPTGLRNLTWIEGILLIQRKLEVLLESEGVERIEAEGKTFDPLYHEAVTHELVEGFEEGQIIGEIQRGYKLGDRVIRPALVRVARAPERPAVKEEPVAPEESAIEGPTAPEEPESDGEPTADTGGDENRDTEARQ